MKIRCPTCGKQYSIDNNNFETEISPRDFPSLDFDNEDIRIKSYFVCPECHDKVYETDLVYRVTLRDVQIIKIIGEVKNQKSNIEFGGKNG